MSQRTESVEVLVIGGVVIGSFDGVAQRTPVDLDALIYSVCGRLLRDLTAEERTIYGIDDKQATCRN